MRSPPPRVSHECKGAHGSVDEQACVRIGQGVRRRARARCDRYSSHMLSRANTPQLPQRSRTRSLSHARAKGNRNVRRDVGHCSRCRWDPSERWSTNVREVRNSSKLLCAHDGERALTPLAVRGLVGLPRYALMKERADQRVCVCVCGRRRRRRRACVLCVWPRAVIPVGRRSLFPL